MSFLEYVAKDIIARHGTNLSDIVVVFPNKRASLFMNDCLAGMAERPIWAPAYTTISDLFGTHSRLKKANDIKLVSDLHKTFCEITGSNEPLDRFFSYGLQMVNDFDDIDKNMADAGQVFGNISGLHEYDNADYLTDSQKEVIRRFFGESDGADISTRLKRRFVTLWNRLYDIYTVYRERLRGQGLAYEGMIYRDVASTGDIDGLAHDGLHIFVGFNLLQKAEQRLFKIYKDHGNARFYWDFDKYYMNDDNEAGQCIRRYLDVFPNELDNDGDIYDNLGKEKRITYIGAPTEDIQARYINRWLEDDGRAAAGRRTAIVMCDETLLPTVIHCISPETGEVNITGGYPLRLSPVSTMIDRLIEMQCEKKLRLHTVRRVLDHPLACRISDGCHDLCRQLIKDKKYYPLPDDLMKDDNLTALFTRAEGNRDILAYLMEIIKIMARGRTDQTETDDTPGTSVMADAIDSGLYKYFTIINTLRQMVESGDLNIETDTMQRLIQQVAGANTLPFSGEPAVGVQIMGVLETRNLDFDHLLLLSCNEGNMPKVTNDTSLIPYSVRKEHSLTTTDNKVAVYSYYFHRLISRAEDITMVYSAGTTDNKLNEMSRFMMQLMVESGHKIKRCMLGTGADCLQTDRADAAVDIAPIVIEKDARIIEKMKQRFCRDENNRKKSISPSAINKYMRCKMQFYFNYVAGLQEPDDNDDTVIDNRIFGNIFHKAAELMYKDERMQKSGVRPTREQITAYVDNAFKTELFNIDEETCDRHALPPLNGMHLINREAVIKYMERLCDIDGRETSILRIITERKTNYDLHIDTSAVISGISVCGIIDRIDEFIDKEGHRRMRVVDYKTGSPPRGKMKNIDEIFSSETSHDKHPDYFLQTMLYAITVSENREYNPDGLPVSPALLFIQAAGADDKDPTLKFDDHPITDISIYADEFKKRLKEKIAEIFDPDIPFVQNDNDKSCRYCPYKELCGRRVVEYDNT